MPGEMRPVMRFDPRSHRTSKGESGSTRAASAISISDDSQSDGSAASEAESSPPHHPVAITVSDFAAAFAS